MSARSKARKRALDVLFEADQRRLPPAEVLDSRIEFSGAVTALPEYAIEIVRGVSATLSGLDQAIAEASEGWALDRMPAVDRTILRIAVWEILHNPEVGAAIAIDEAVELAACLSTDDSASFVNGVLGTIARSVQGGHDVSPGDPVE